MVVVIARGDQFKRTNGRKKGWNFMAAGRGGCRVLVRFDSNSIRYRFDTSRIQLSQVQVGSGNECAKGHPKGGKQQDTIFTMTLLR